MYNTTVGLFTILEAIMSNYHILAADEAANKYTVVFHVPVPDTTNLVGVNYRTIVSTLFSGESAYPLIDAGEQAQLDSGELFETTRPYYSRPDQDLAAKRDELDVMYAQVVSEEQADFADKYGYWGYSRNVP
jgi:hypothetical protein